MTPETTKRLRINLLRQLAAAAPLPMPVPALATGAKMEAFKVADEEIARELEYLADLAEPMAARVKEAFSGAVRRYKIMPPGRDWLEMEGF